MTHDLEYKTDGMFTRFYPNTKAGEEAWNTIASQNEGVAAVFTVHLTSTLSQLRKAGYSVKKASKTGSIDDIDLSELGIV
jgi:hypothetical protein